MPAIAGSGWQMTLSQSCRFRVGVQVSVDVVGPGPQPLLSVIPADPRRGRRQARHRPGDRCQLHQAGQPSRRQRSQLAVRRLVDVRDKRLGGGGIAVQRLQVHQRLGARKASHPQCPVHNRASGEPRHARPHLDDHLPAVCQPKPLHGGQVAGPEQFRRWRRSEPARAPVGQRMNTHGRAAGLGHHPILPKPAASDGLYPGWLSRAGPRSSRGCGPHLPRC